MAKGEGAEQYAAASLLPTKPISQDGIKIGKVSTIILWLFICGIINYLHLDYRYQQIII